MKSLIQKLCVYFLLYFLSALSVVAFNNAKLSSKNIDSLLIENVVSINFSDTNKEDKFRIAIYGESVITGTVIFTITNSEGTKLLNEKFDALALLGYGLLELEIPNIANKEEYIRQRIKTFFDKENFYLPAIKQDEIYEEDYSNIDIWNDILSDKSAVGFYYLIGEDNGRKIAFSKKRKQIFVYFSCC